MARIVAVGRRRAAGIVGQRVLARDRGKALGVRRIFDDAEHRAVLRRRQPMAARDRRRRCRDCRLASRRSPTVHARWRCPWCAEYVRGRGVDDEDRFSGRVMAGHDAANLSLVIDFLVIARSFTRARTHSRTHVGEQFLGRIGIRRQAVFHLHGLDRLAAFQTQEAVDLADIVAGSEPAASCNSLTCSNGSAGGGLPR